MNSDLTDLLDKKSELDFNLVEVKIDLNKVEGEILNELIKTRSFEFLSINYKKLKSSMR